MSPAAPGMTPNTRRKEQAERELEAGPQFWESLGAAGAQLGAHDESETARGWQLPFSAVFTGPGAGAGCSFPEKDPVVY